MIDNLIYAFGLVAEPAVLAAIVGGAFLGYLIGAMPGLGPTLGVALLIPFTFGMDPVVSLVALVSLYAAAEYGAGITAILLNTPGTAAAVATTWDGYPMAQQGKAGEALNISIISSGIGALMSAILLVFTAVYLAEFSLRFGPTEYFALGIFGLSLVNSLSGGSVSAGFLAMCLGLLISAVGLDPVSGVPRFAFHTDLFDGIPLVPALLGLYAISEVFMMVEGTATRKESMAIKGILAVPLKYYKSVWWTILRSGGLGYVIGVIPGAGASIASIISYNEAKRSSKDPDSFGKGNPEGIVASETANNASVSGALAPLLALGIPGSATTAVMIGALMVHGLQPGPLLFSRNPEIPYSIFVSLILSVFVMVAIGLIGARFWVKVANVPKSLLAAIVTGICLIGSYASYNSMFPVYVTLSLGFLGYILRKANVPLAPVVLSLVLGPMIETNYRKALSISQGSHDIFLSHPITLALLFLSALSLLMPIVQGRRRKAGSIKGRTA